MPTLLQRQTEAQDQSSRRSDRPNHRISSSAARAALRFRPVRAVTRLPRAERDGIGIGRTGPRDTTKTNKRPADTYVWVLTSRPTRVMTPRGTGGTARHYGTCYHGTTSANGPRCTIGYDRRARSSRAHLHEAGGHVALLAGLDIHVPQLRILMRRQQKVAVWHAFIVPDMTPESRCRCGRCGSG
jgi:hypothetical protein